MRKPLKDHHADPFLPSSTAVMPGQDTESSPLLRTLSNDTTVEEHKRNVKSQQIVWGGLILLFFAFLIPLVFFPSLFSEVFPWLGYLPKDPDAAALVILKNAPVIVSMQGFASVSLNRQTRGIFRTDTLVSFCFFSELPTWTVI